MTEPSPYTNIQLKNLSYFPIKDDEFNESMSYQKDWTIVSKICELDKIPEKRLSIAKIISKIEHIENIKIMEKTHGASYIYTT